MVIKLEKQYISTSNNKSRLNFDFLIDNNPQTVWYEVDNEYAQYLCTERCDAFIIGVLPFALTKNHDIISNIPITEELSYKINENLIPLLNRYDKHTSFIKVIAPMTDEVLQNAGAVGTGVSGGSDSFNTILSTYNSTYKDLKLTHLCIFNVGSFGGNDNYQEDIYREVIKRGKLIAEEYKLPLIISNSNLADVFPRNHSYTHDYSSIFGICCLQKLWKAYYYASSNTDINVFSIINSSKNDSDEYEPLLYYCFNNKNLNVISEGMQKNKLEKIEYIANSPIVQKYLHVCTNNKNNCSKCYKCIRVILALDAIGKLDDFAQVFDVEYYKKNKFKYYWVMFEKHYHRAPMMEPIYKAMKPKIPFIQFCILKFLVGLKYFIYDETYPERKTYINIKILGINFKFKKR